MKILFLLQELPYPLNHGFRVRLLNIISSMSKDNECHVISFIWDNTDKDNEAFKKRFPDIKLLKLFPLSSGLSLQKQRMKLFLGNKPVFLARWQNHNLGKYLRKLAKDEKYDLVYFDGLGVSPYRSCFKNLPTVISTSDAVSWVYMEAARASRFSIEKIHKIYTSKMIARYEKKVLPLFSKVHVVSKKDMDFYKKLSSEIDIAVIEHVVPDDLLQYSDRGAGPSRSNRILYTGSLTSKPIIKGLLSFLKNGYARILEKLPMIEMVILGRNAPPEARREVSAFPNIIFRDWVDDYYAELSKAEILIFSDWTGTGVKTRVLYALGLGKPVVATPAALNGIEVKDGTHCFVRTLDEGFYEAVLTLLKNSEMRNEMGRNARELIVQKYSNEAVSPKWNKLCEMAIDKHHAGVQS